MAINNNDVKLFESQRLSDEEDGGGRVTGREVIDGNVKKSGVRSFIVQKNLGSGLSLCKHLVYHHKRHVLCKIPSR